MDISKHLDKNNLHHAYLIEGAGEKIVPEILKYMENVGIKTSGNPDFCNISVDFLKIKQALDLREMATERSFAVGLPDGRAGKKIFVICANRFSLDAQGVLLKMFEEPIENTHFFVITPDINILAKTLISRCYLIKSKIDLEDKLQEANKFIAMPLKNRIDFIKEFVAVSEDEDNDTEIIEKNSVRSKAFEFLNALEYILHQKVFVKDSPSQAREGLSFTKIDCFDQIFKAREFLRQPGSPAKTLMESVAIVVPVL
jgi:DNA polymerase III delta prime subunit